MIDCFCGGAVVPVHGARDKFEAIRKIIRTAPVFSALAHPAEVEEAVVQRERACGTGLGRGVAVAHGATSQLDGLVVALGLPAGGIDFGAPDGEPVRLLFVIVHPPELQTDYLIALASVTRMVRDRDFRESLDPSLPPELLERRLAQAFRGCLSHYCRTVA